MLELNQRSKPGPFELVIFVSYIALFGTIISLHNKYSIEYLSRDNAY